MEETKTVIENPPVFPDPMRGTNLDVNSHSKEEFTLGISLRDYFAAKVLQGILSDPKRMPVLEYVEICRHAYIVADTMLKQRSQP
jgi:hypothetical protein